MTLIATQPHESPQPHRFTREEYYRMAELGLFEGHRVELIEGEIIEMAAQKNPHVLSVSLAAQALAKAFGDQYWVRSQAPLSLPGASEPEPDIAVVPGPMKSYRDHPTTALLVVEVSDTTLRFDLGKKANLYARAGIADYWVINLVDNRVVVLREPVKDSEAPFGWRYRSVVALRTGERLSPLARAEAVIEVSGLLP